MSNDFLILYLKDLYFGFQDPGSPIMEGIMDLHHHIMFFLVLILVVVSWLLFEVVYVDEWFTKNMSTYLLAVHSFYNQYVKRVLYREFFLSFAPGNRDGDNHILFRIIRRKIWTSERFTHNKKFEIIWTLLPGLILTFIAIPSFGLLYASDELLDPYLTIQVEGHQWYWTYEFNPHFLGFSSYFSDDIKVEFDSFLINDEMLDLYVDKSKGFCFGFSHSDFYKDYKILVNLNICINDIKSFLCLQKVNLNCESNLIKNLDLLQKLTKKNLNFPYLRLLEVDNVLVLPMRVQIRFIIESVDVLHCWAVPSLGIKLDAVPGRMNQCSVFIKRAGLFFGQCSEICGTHHGFMPICIESTLVDRYFFYYLNKDSCLFFDDKSSLSFDKKI